MDGGSRNNQAYNLSLLTTYDSIYRTTSEAITKNAIIAIILLILRYFQRKGLCNSGLKAKSTTFVRNITTIRLRSQFVILKMDINMTDKIGKRRAANCVYHIGASIKDLGKKWFGFSKMEILTPDELVERINRV